MRYILALLTFNGLSLLAWGFAGACRLVYEHTRHLGGRLLAIAPAALLAGLLGSLFLVVSTKPFMGLLYAAVAPWSLESATLVDVRTAGVFVWTFACGVLASYVAARLFRVRHLIAGASLFAAGYGLAVAALALDDTDLELLFSGSLVAGDVSPWLPLAVLATAGSLVGLVGAKARVARVLPQDKGSEAWPRRLSAADVAVVVCAHNEEEAIRVCLTAAKKLVSADQIFVGSDGSTDGTVAAAAEHGCHILDIRPNGGKARALKRVLAHFDLWNRFEAILILDADAQIDPSYLDYALPLFDDPEVAAVAGHAIPKWYAHRSLRKAMFYPAYRTRLYWITQILLRYGQTWKHANVSFIVPGFASMYRARVLPHIDIDAPGLSVEDFNMTFDLHRKKLGKVAYSPRVRCISQEAHNLRDYYKQVRRWYLGFWQTVRRHGFWPSFFWVSLGIFVVELILQCVAFLTFPFVVTWIVVQGGPVEVWLPHVGAVDLAVADLVLGVLAADYAMTLLVAIGTQNPMIAIYGLGFMLLRWIDALIFLYTLPLAFFDKSDGRWVSPARI